MIDTHTHIDGEEFAEDRAQTVLRAQEAGVEKIFVPAMAGKMCISPPSARKMGGGRDCRGRTARE